MRTRIHWLLLPLLLAGTSIAQAEEPLPHDPEAKRRTVLVGGKVRPGREEPDPDMDETSNRPAWTQQLRIAKKHGFELRQPVRLGEHDITLGLKGPVMKRKRLGLTFEVRF